MLEPGLKTNLGTFMFKQGLRGSLQKVMHGSEPATEIFLVGSKVGHKNFLAHLCKCGVESFLTELTITDEFPFFDGVTVLPTGLIFSLLNYY